MIISSRAQERKEIKEKETEWANTIKNRDGWKCVICGTDYHPNAHHIIPREHKEYKFDYSNGITLCTKHHKFSRFISAHNAPFAFFMWLERYRYEQYCLARVRAASLAKEEVWL